MKEVNKRWCVGFSKNNQCTKDVLEFLSKQYDLAFDDNNGLIFAEYTYPPSITRLLSEIELICKHYISIWNEVFYSKCDL